MVSETLLYYSVVLCSNKDVAKMLVEEDFKSSGTLKLFRELVKKQPGINGV